MRIKHGLWMLLFAALSACGTAPAKGADGAAQTQIVATFAAQLTQTAVSAPATIEPEDAESPEETETPFVTPTPDAGTLLLGRFRTVTVSQGNLFVRDGTGVPIQITKSGTDHDPIISPDGKKIVFYRGEKFDNVFTINADGSGEKELINKNLLPALEQSQVKFLSFQVRTHQLFFNVNRSICESTLCTVKHFMVDVDSAKITEFANGLNGSIEVSPDGHYLSVIHAGQMDLHNFDGKILHSNIINAPGKILQLQHWLPDSTGLIVVFSTDIQPEVYSIWRYLLKNNYAEQIPFGSALTMSTVARCLFFSISPDRNLILYHDSEQKSHLGHLKTGQVQAYGWDSNCSVKWSEDSQHFASETAIGAVDGTPQILLDGHFIAWIDSTHYLFSKGKGILDLQTYIAEVGKESAAVPTNFIWSPVFAVLEPTPAP